MACQMYQMDGWFGIAESEIEAMSLMVKSGPPGVFATFGTTHAQAEYFKTHGVLSDELCPFRYVQGLRNDDPEDLIVMYRKTKTRWKKKYKLQPDAKWLVMGPRCDGYWGYEGGWVDTSEFKRRLKKTLEFLEQNQRPNGQQTVKAHLAFLDAIRE